MTLLLNSNIPGNHCYSQNKLWYMLPHTASGINIFLRFLFPIHHALLFLVYYIQRGTQRYIKARPQIEYCQQSIMLSLLSFILISSLNYGSLRTIDHKLWDVIPGQCVSTVFVRPNIYEIVPNITICQYRCVNASFGNFIPSMVSQVLFHKALHLVELSSPWNKNRLTNLFENSGILSFVLT